MVGCLCFYINVKFLGVLLYLLVTTSPATAMSYSVKFLLVFIFLGANFITPKSGHCFEIQPY